MRFGFGLSIIAALMLGGCVGTEVRNDRVRISSNDAGPFCRGLATRAGSPEEAGCLRALGRDLRSGEQADAARLRYAMGQIGTALASESAERRGTPVRCAEDTVAGTFVTTCR